MIRISMAALFTGLLILSCGRKENIKENPKSANGPSLFETMSPSQTGIQFNNQITEDEDINYLHYGYLYNGGGVAAGDINNDGLTDLYFGSNLEYNKLYLNEGDFKFRDITSTAGVDGGTGYKSGVTMADINQDGWLDLFVCKTAIRDSGYRHKMLYINNHDGTFTDRATEYGLDDLCYTTQAYFFDSDGDGDLDVYFVNHPMNFEDNNYIQPVLPEATVRTKGAESKYTSDRFYENRNGKFVDITTSAGITNEAFGLSAVVADFNEDGRPDVYVANDFLQPDYLYINLGHNKFKESFDKHFDHCSFSSMGTDYADINNDGCNDLMAVDMTPSERTRQNLLMMTQNYDRYQLMLRSGLKAQFSINSLQLGACGGQFSDIAFYTGTAYTDWSWTPLLADFNNDGKKDIFITNGYLRDVMNNDYNRYKLDSLEKLHIAGRISQVNWIKEIPSTKVSDFLFENKGDLQFSDQSAQWNSGPPTFSHGACYSDLDNDGDLDLIVSNVNDPATLLRNRSREISNHHFIRFSLQDARHRPLEGTRIQITMQDHQIQTQCYQQTRGFLSRCEDILHFGLGPSGTVSKAEIFWPDGSSSELLQPAVDKVHEVEWKDSKKTPSTTIKALLKETACTAGMAHLENEFIDYKREPLLIDALSADGPGIATGDVNQDGLDDVYIGGSTGRPSSLWLQNKNGSFSAANAEALNKNIQREVTDAVFADFNGDKLPDLYEVHGSNESDVDAYYQDRIYINKGQGRFEETGVIPSENHSGSCVCAADIDGDGDLDLFVGTRSTPGRYPECSGHMLLINENGRFDNKIDELIPALKDDLMISDAVFEDLDRSGHPELIVAGEYSPVRIFSFDGMPASEKTNEYGLGQCTGLWRSLATADINGDGFTDIVAGNYGLNSHLRASLEKPLEIYYDDFDRNGSLDAVLCQYENDKSYPVLYRDRLLDQMVFLKKKFTRFEPYSRAAIQEVFSAGQLEAAKKYKATDLASKILISEQGRHFRITNLPPCSQFSIVTGIVADDFNQDNRKDIITVGNSFHTDAQFGRHDSSHGCLCEGKESGDLLTIPGHKGGLKLTGDIRKILPLKSSSGTSYLIGRNNGPCSILSLN